MESKVCAGCNANQPSTNFFRKADSKDQLSPYCKTCKKSIDRAYRAKNKERIAERTKTYRKLNKQAIYEAKRRYREENREAIQDRKRKYRELNREKVSTYFSLYKKARRALYNASNAKRKALKKAATPSWLTPYDFDMITMFYEAAAAQKQYGLICHVDHIIPLQGKDVCGLHVPWNLQVLTASENVRKGNRLE